MAAVGEVVTRKETPLDLRCIVLMRGLSGVGYDIQGSFAIASVLSRVISPADWVVCCDQNTCRVLIPTPQGSETEFIRFSSQDGEPIFRITESEVMAGGRIVGLEEHKQGDETEGVTLFTDDGKKFMVSANRVDGKYLSFVLGSGTVAAGEEVPTLEQGLL